MHHHHYHHHSNDTSLFACCTSSLPPFLLDNTSNSPVTLSLSPFSIPEKHTDPSISLADFFIHFPLCSSVPFPLPFFAPSFFLHYYTIPWTSCPQACIFSSLELKSSEAVPFPDVWQQTNSAPGHIWPFVYNQMSWEMGETSQRKSGE